MKKNKIIFWTATLIIFAFEGLMPLFSLLFAPDQVTIGTRPLGYPDYFAYALAISKVLGATAITLPRIPATLKEWAYAGLSFDLVFALISHAAVDGNIGFILMPVVIGVILALSYYYGKKLHQH